MVPTARNFELFDKKQVTGLKQTNKQKQKQNKTFFKALTPILEDVSVAETIV